MEIACNATGYVLALHWMRRRGSEHAVLFGIATKEGHS